MTFGKNPDTQIIFANEKILDTYIRLKNTMTQINFFNLNFFDLKSDTKKLRYKKKLKHSWVIGCPKFLKR